MPGFDDEEDKRRPNVFGTFVDDVCGVVKSRGDLGTLSHTYSALSLCGGGRRLPIWDYDGDATGEGGTQPRAPSVYEMSVETAQKRAYASNCYTRLLSGSDDSDYLEASMIGERATGFIEDLARLARTDIVVLEIMCLALLEPWRRTGYTRTTRTESSVREPLFTSHADDPLQSSLKSTLLRQASGCKARAAT